MSCAMNTGHDGSLTTLHANAPEEAVMRLTAMVRYGADLPVDVIEAHIASAIDLVVQIVRGADGARFVSKIAELVHADGRKGCRVNVLYERAHGKSEGCWNSVPDWVSKERNKDAAHGEEVALWEDRARLCG